MIIKNFLKKTQNNKSPISSKDWNKRISPFAVDIIKKLQDHNYEAYLVGGCVRDLLLEPEKHSVDIDIMVEGDGIEFANKLGKKLKVSTVVPFPKFATARIPYKECEIEVASARLESYDPKSVSYTHLTLPTTTSV